LVQLKLELSRDFHGR